MYVRMYVAMAAQVVRECECVCVCTMYMSRSTKASIDSLMHACMRVRGFAEANIDPR